MRAGIFVFIVAVFAAVVYADSLPSFGSVNYDPTTGKYNFYESVNENAAAYGRFYDELFSYGWGGLHVHSNAKYDDEVQAYAAGYLEGRLTHARMADYFHNTKKYMLASDWKGYDDWPKTVTTWMSKNEIYIRHQVAEHRQEDNYFYQLGLVLAQFDGLLAGYNSVAKAAEKIDSVDMWIYQSAGDLDDLAGFLVPEVALDRASRPQSWFETHSHCTGMVKLLDDWSDVFMTQVTWNGFVSMNRILKHYNLNFNHQSNQARTIVFSSYASILFSVDDFYITDQKLSILETTFNIFNHSLYDEFITHDTVMTWMRVQVSNRMAITGEEWIEFITRFNSGTYNNQWLALDHKRFTPGYRPTPGLLTVAEMIPGHVKIFDRTEWLLGHSYYPSINTPSDVELFDLAGYPAMVKKWGGYWSYDNSSRWNIMVRDVRRNVTDFEKFKTFTRYNDWQHDPFSHGDPGQSICSRYDLRDPDFHKFNRTAAPFGGTDSKCTNHALVEEMKFHCISSPTYDQQPIWQFGTKQFDYVPWRGMPQAWEFPWVEFSTAEVGFLPEKTHFAPEIDAQHMTVLLAAALIGCVVAVLVFAFSRNKDPVRAGAGGNSYAQVVGESATV